MTTVADQTGTELEKIKLGRSNEPLTGQGGLIGIAEYLRGMGLEQLVKKHLPKPGSNRGFGPSVFVQMLILLSLMEGRTLSDLRELEREKPLMDLLGMETIPDEDTVGQWLRRMGDPDPEGKQAGLVGLGKVRDEINRSILTRDGVDWYTGDLDATFIASGKSTAKYSYRNEKGYMPMMMAFAETPVFVVDEFREGNVSPQDGHIAVYRQGKALAESVGKTLARFRADSASYRADLINVLEEDGVIYTITADKDAAVMREIGTIAEEDWKKATMASGEECEIAETVHTMDKTKNAFRLVVKRVRDRSMPLSELLVTYRYWAVATNFDEKVSAVRVLEWHQLRGTFENGFKGLKNDVGMRYLPTNDTHANAVFFRIGVLTYNLVVGFRQDLLPASARRWTLPTIRWKVFRMPGRVVRHARSLWLKLAVPMPDLAFLEEIRHRCRALFPPPCRV